MLCVSNNKELHFTQHSKPVQHFNNEANMFKDTFSLTLCGKYATLTFKKILFYHLFLFRSSYQHLSLSIPVILQILEYLGW